MGGDQGIGISCQRYFQTNSYIHKKITNKDLHSTKLPRVLHCSTRILTDASDTDALVWVTLPCSFPGPRVWCSGVLVRVVPGSQVPGHRVDLPLNLEPPVFWRKGTGLPWLDLLNGSIGAGIRGFIGRREGDFLIPSPFYLLAPFWSTNLSPTLGGSFQHIWGLPIKRRTRGLGGQ